MRLLISVDAKVTDLSKGNKALRDLMKQFGGAEVTIGVYADATPYPGGQTVAEVALWNEFGTTKIPERSFFRSAVDDNQGAIDGLVEKMWTQALEADSNTASAKMKVVKLYLNKIGFLVKTLIEAKITSNLPPPYGTGKGKATSEEIARRQEYKRKAGAIMGSNTLVWTGHLLKSISYVVKIGSSKEKSK